MLINPITLTVFSTVLNRYVKLDPQSHRHLEPLQKKILFIDLLGTNKTIYFLFSEDGIDVLQSCDTKPDATIKASPVTLVRVFASKDKKLVDEDLVLEGKVRVAQDVQVLFSSLEVDWEEQLSRLTNDVVAHHVSSLAREITAFLKDAGKSAQVSTVDYLQEDGGVLIPKVRMDRFCEDVDDVAMQTDRLAARIALLEKTKK